MQIVLEDIRKYFGEVKANDGINLTFEPGKIYGILGENGAGKSTLMKIVSGYQAPDSGQIRKDGQAVSFRSPQEALAAGIGMLYQDPLDIPPFNIVENYLLGKNNKFILNKTEAVSHLQELARRYGFQVDVESRIDALSIGERQQLELVRLLAGGAQTLILDEPTTGISADQQEILFDSLRKLAHEEGKTLITVSHKLEDVQELCEQAFVLRKGKLVGGAEIPCPNQTLVQMMFESLPARRERPDHSQDAILLNIENVSVKTRRMEIEDINLDVRVGEIFGFAGLEGSGQGLLMQAIAGLEQLSQGKMSMEDRPISHLNYHQRTQTGIAYLPAGRIEEGLVGGLTLTEHMVLISPEKSWYIDWDASGNDTQARIQRFQVVGSPGTKAEELSGGNQQRLLFAMLNSPLKLLLLDKPTRGLDIMSTDWIWKELDHWREEGATIIFISEDLDEIVERSDRIAVFFEGKIQRVVKASETNEDELGHLIGGQS